MSLSAAAVPCNCQDKRFCTAPLMWPLVLHEAPSVNPHAISWVGLLTAGAFGTCRKSCKMCEDCAKDDATCRARNRIAAGFPSLDELF